MSTTLDRVIPIVAKQLGRDPSEFSADTDLQDGAAFSVHIPAVDAVGGGAGGQADGEVGHGDARSDG